MTIRDALRRQPKIESDLLLAHVLDKSREFLYTNPEQRLTNKQWQKFRTLCARRKKSEPVAYLVGYKDFYGLRHKVNKDVLIPRPETEWLVDQALSTLPSLKKKSSKPKLRILDLGTGSGCIAISLAKNLPNDGYGLWGSDISKKALSIAKFNAVKHGAKIKFIRSDLFAKIPGRFDLIIANLPYVPIKDYTRQKNNLKFEPRLALSDGGNTWKLYEKLFRTLRGYINKKALIMLEIDPGSENLIKTWGLKYLPNTNIKFFKDLRGLVRYAVLSVPA